MERDKREELFWTERMVSRRVEGMLLNRRKKSGSCTVIETKGRNCFMETVVKIRTKYYTLLI